MCLQVQFYCNRNINIVILLVVKARANNCNVFYIHDFRQLQYTFLNDKNEFGLD